MQSRWALLPRLNCLLRRVGLAGGQRSNVEAGAACTLGLAIPAVAAVMSMCCASQSATSMWPPCFPAPQGSFEDMYDDGHEGGHFKAFSGTARTLAGSPRAG